MTLETILNILPCEINGYALRITRYYDSDEKADMWEVAYIGDKNKYMYCTTAQTLEVAALQTIPHLINNGLGSKNCADCVLAEYPPCNKGIPCCKCGDECNSRQPCQKKGGEK